MTVCRLIVLVSRDDADTVSGSVMAWRLSLVMERALHRRRLVSLVTPTGDRLGLVSDLDIRSGH